jgi:hypothetical protein
LILSGCRIGIKGKAVRIRCGPATVNGDDNRINPLAKFGREGADYRLIHEPGDLPDNRNMRSAFEVKAVSGELYKKPRFGFTKAGFFYLQKP